MDFSILKTYESAHSKCCTALRGFFFHEIACDIFLDLYLEFDDSGRLSTKIYDKWDDFNFKIINFLNMCSSIPVSPAYGVCISQSIRPCKGQ
jgi:hypothetical protein